MKDAALMIQLICGLYMSLNVVFNLTEIIFVAHCMFISSLVLFVLFVTFRLIAKNSVVSKLMSSLEVNKTRLAPAKQGRVAAD